MSFLEIMCLLYSLSKEKKRQTGEKEYVCVPVRCGAQGWTTVTVTVSVRSVVRRGIV